MKEYIAEIAGKDSVAAILCFAEKHNGIRITPTVVLTGTEYGDMAAYEKNIAFLKDRLNTCNVVFMDTVYLQNGALWNLLNAKYQYMIYKKFHFYTPCIMCHLYTHLLRIQIYKEHSAVGLITGERKSHSGKLKANQHDHTIALFGDILRGAGIEPICPLLEIEDTAAIDAMISDCDIIRCANDVKCVLSNNLQGFPMEDCSNVRLLDQFLEEYVAPVGHCCAESIDEDGCIKLEQLEYFIMQILQ